MIANPSCGVYPLKLFISIRIYLTRLYKNPHSIALELDFRSVAVARRPVRIARGSRLHLDDAVVHRVQFRAPPRVVLPQQDGLIVDELAALCADDLAPKVLVLQQIEEVQAHRVLQIASVFRLLPVQQVLQVVDERRVFEVAALCDDCLVREVLINYQSCSIKLNINNYVQCR